MYNNLTEKDIIDLKKAVDIMSQQKHLSKLNDIELLAVNTILNETKILYQALFIAAKEINPSFSSRACEQLAKWWIDKSRQEK